MNSNDKWEIVELIGHYGYCVDDRDWEGLARVFAEDVTYDFRDFGGPLCESLDAVREFFVSIPHPQAHHVTNVVIEPAGGGAVVRSKFICPRADYTTSTGEYADELARTPAGWRITRRRATLRSEPPAHYRQS